MEARSRAWIWAAQKPSGSIRCCCRRIRTTRATTRCMYQLARAYETTGQPEKALDTLDEIVRRYPASRDIAEVHFRRGELLFSAGRYRDADVAYAEVIRPGQGAYYQQALYKRAGRCSSRPCIDDSLPVFARLLDLKLLDSTSPRGFRSARNTEPRADRELVDDTLRVMSVTFSDLDGIEPLNRFRRPHRSTRRIRRCCIRAWAICTSRSSATRTVLRAYRAFVARDAQQRILAGALHAVPSRPTARAALRSWCSKASANTSRTTTSGRRSGRGAIARTIRRSLPRSRRISPTLPPTIIPRRRNRASAGGLRAGGPLVSPAAAVPSRKMRIPRRSTSGSPTCCSKAVSSRTAVDRIRALGLRLSGR